MAKSTMNTRETIVNKTLNILQEYPDGLHFNDLLRKIGENRSTVNKTIKEMVKDKIITSRKSKHHKQGRIYSLDAAYQQYLKNGKMLDKFGNFVQLLLHKLEFALETGVFKSTEGAKQAVSSFSNKFSDLLSDIYLITDQLSEPFPIKYKNMFFHRAHDIVRYKLVLYKKILEKNHFEEVGLRFKSRSHSFDDLGSNSAFIYWIKTTDKFPHAQALNMIEMVNNGVEISYSSKWKSSLNKREKV